MGGRPQKEWISAAREWIRTKNVSDEKAKHLVQRKHFVYRVGEWRCQSRLLNQPRIQSEKLRSVYVSVKFHVSV